MKKYYYRAFQVACNARTAMQLQHVIKLKLSSQLIGQFGHVTASASCKQPEKHGIRFKMASGIRRKSAPSRLVISDVHSDSPCQECILCKSKQHVYTHPLKWKDQSLFTYLRDIEPEMFIDATACICRNCKADLANGKKRPCPLPPTVDS